MSAPVNFRQLVWGGIALSACALIFILSNDEPKGRIFWYLLTIYDTPAAAVMIGVLIAGLVVGLRGPGDGKWSERLVLTVERQRYVLAVLLWLVLAVCSVFVYQSHPLSMDEYAAYFQAQVFAAGATHGRFPPELLDSLIPRAFQNQFLMVNRTTGAVFSAYWPGFSLLLTPFVAMGIPWACNPTIVALSFLLIGRVARDTIRAPGAAGWAMLFAIGSPALVINGISYYSMPAHLLFNLLFAWLLLSPSPLRLFLAGLAGGYALVLHNPFPHFVFAVPWIVWLAMRGRQTLRNLCYFGLGYAPVVLCLGLGWALWQQHTMQADVAAMASTAVSGSSEAAPRLPTLDWTMGLVFKLFRVLALPDGDIVNARFGGLVKLWLWGSPLLLLLAWQRERTERDTTLRLLEASALLTFIAYFAIPFDQGHGWGYRYFHSAWGVLPVLAAAGVQTLSSTHGDPIRPLPSLAVMVLSSILVMNGLRIFQIDGFVAAHLGQRPPMHATGRQLLFHYGGGYYGEDLIQNDPWLRGRTVALLKQNAQDDASIARRYFPGGYTVERNNFGVAYFAAE